MDDLEFVQRCIKGDKLAWNAFVEKYSRLIYNYIHRVLAVQGVNLASPGESAQDLAQEIFLSLLKDNFRKLRTFKGKNGCTLATWLRVVTVHATLDYLRKARPLASLDAEDEEGFALTEVLPSSNASAAEEFSLKERQQTLKDCISRLDRDERHFLELHLNLGLSIEETKNVLGISRGAADMRKSRITDKLRECFRRKGFRLDS